ncbi:hypothetical protein MCUN1_002466 [Malassezia cuniculi]|uniref:Urease accessory protein UreD n=1 Tax=Malassezia cuniculi TaxID=948313 RepID=A0AAF0J6V6_9BASI|nr:hypothetical protein MCUN1_002466 [Malassezia cuniculi]
MPLAAPQNAKGRATLRKAGRVPVFSQLECEFPLRLLSPYTAAKNATEAAAEYAANAQLAERGVGVLYVVSFGGGLVSGDAIALDIDVGEETRLIVLTQGSTKVYREKRGNDPAMAGVPRAAGPVSSQYMRYIVRPNATLILLADPVTCFARARYSQVQRVDLRSERSSLVLLDWFTSGRLAVEADSGRVPEFWHFYLYHSRNEVRVAGNVVVRDIQRLEQDLPEVLGQSATDLGKRCAPYTCYATLILYGPECAAMCASLTAEFGQIQQGQPLRGGSCDAPELLWSLSSLQAEPAAGGSQATVSRLPGVVVRVAARETDELKRWLYERLGHLRTLVGDDMYRISLG